MKLNRPNLDRLLIITTSISFIIGIILLFTNIILTREKVLEISKNENILELIKNNEDIKLVFDDNKLPITILDNINKKDINNLVDKSVERVYTGENILDDDDIKTLLRNAINKYERKKDIDIYNNIIEDISKTSSKVTRDINNSSNLAYFNSIREMSYFYVLFIIISIVGFALLFVFENINGITIDGIIITLSSIATYYLVNSSKYDIIKQLKFWSVDNIVLNNTINYTLSILCGIVFFVGAIVIIISSTKLIDRGLRELRMKYLYGYK